MNFLEEPLPGVVHLEEFRWIGESLWISESLSNSRKSVAVYDSHVLMML